MFGLYERDVDMIVNALKENKEIEQAFIFGSRALGNYKKESDVDLVVTSENVTDKTIANLNELINETYPLSYFFEILQYEKIQSEHLKKHIDKHGVDVYVRGMSSRAK